MSVWPGRLARAGSGILVLGVVGAVGAAAWLAPLPDDVVVEAAVLPVPPGPTTLVCPGPVTLPDAVDDVDPEFNPAPVGSVDSARFVVRGEVGARPLDVRALESLRGDPLASGLVVDPAGAGIVTSEPETALVARAEPADDVVPRVAAAVSSLVTAGDLRGTAAAACQHPASEIWLVGGATQLGSTALLTVHNPGATPAEIRLDLWGPAGQVDLGGAARYVVPSGGDVSLRISAFAPEEARTVLRVTSAGGQIAAHLQVSDLDGFTPGGVDLVVPAAPPAERQVIGSVVVPTSEVGGPGAARLRLLAPGDGLTRSEGAVAGDDADSAGTPGAASEAAGALDSAGASGPAGASGAAGESDAAGESVVPDGADAGDGSQLPERFMARVTLLGPDGPVELPGAENVELVVDEVVDVDLGGLPAGAYGVVVEAERPVLAAVRTERVGQAAQDGDTPPVELAWTAATNGSADRLVAIPAGLSTSVVATTVPAPEGDGASDGGDGRGDGDDDDGDDGDVDAGVGDEASGGSGTVGVVTARMRVFDAGGAEILVEEISVPAGRTLSVPLPQDAAAVDIVPVDADSGVTGGASLVWGVVAETARADGTFLSVLTPPLRGDAVDEVSVKQGQRLPLE